MKTWGCKKVDRAENWPKGSEGEFEEPEFLMHASESQMEAEMIINLLKAYNIPVVCRYPNNGDFGRVILGLSAMGVDLYVPKSSLSEAKDILRGGEEPDGEEN